MTAKNTGPRVIIEAKRTLAGTAPWQCDYDLRFVVRNAMNDDVIREYFGWVSQTVEDPPKILDKRDVQSVELSSDPSKLIIEYAWGEREVRSVERLLTPHDHPDWRIERTIAESGGADASDEAQVTYRVVHKATGKVIKTIQGTEFRGPSIPTPNDTGKIRWVEFDDSQQWVVVNRVGERQDCYELNAPSGVTS
jgi:hypothetical protein